MKTVIIGSIVFLFWSAGSTYLYVCHIKQLCTEVSEQVDQTSLELPTKDTPAVAEQEIAQEPEVKIEAPGSFTVYHKFDRQEFISDPKFGQYIEQAGTFVAQSENPKIALVGYTDNIGSDEYNYNLGLERAVFTKNFMVENGMPETIISITSKGETSPIASNDTKAGRAQNRRTEIQINN